MNESFAPMSIPRLPPERWSDSPENALALLTGFGFIIAALSACSLEAFSLDGLAAWEAVHNVISVGPKLLGIFGVVFCMALAVRNRKPALAEGLASVACMPLMVPLVAAFAVLKTDDIAVVGVSMGALMMWGGLTSYVGVKLLMFSGRQLARFRVTARK